MSKTNIHTNLLGKICRLTAEARTHPRWHDEHRWDHSGVPGSEPVFVGDFAKIPGGPDGAAKIVAVYLKTEDGETKMFATIRWIIGGSMKTDIDLEWLVIPEQQEE